MQNISTHGYLIFSNVKIKEKFENGEFYDKFFREDSGFTLKPHLITPTRNPITCAESIYNEAHILPRNTVKK
jgi:hypothetical protein